MFFLSKFLTYGVCYGGTLLQRIVQSGESPSNVAFNYIKRKCDIEYNDGIIDSLRYLIYSDNYVKPWSEEHLLACLLTKCF